MQFLKINRFYLLLVLLAVTLFWNNWIPLIHDTYQLEQPTPDFFVYYAAGKSMNEGYNPYLSNPILDEAIIDNRVDGYSMYLYPPTLLPFYRLFGHLEYLTAAKLWPLIYLSIFLVACALLLRMTDAPQRPLLATLILILVSISFPVQMMFQRGQIDLINAALIMLSFLLHQRENRAGSAVLLATATLIKVNPAILLIYFVIYRRDLRYLLYFGAACAGIILVSLLFVSPDLYRMYIEEVIPHVTQGTNYFANQSALKLAPPIGLIPRLISSVGFLICILLSWLSFRKRYPVLPFKNDAVFLFNITAILLFSAIVWQMHYVWLLLPMANFLLSLLIYRIKHSYFVLMLVVVFLISAQAREARFIHSLNLIGGGLLFYSLAILILRPDLVVEKSQPEPAVDHQ